MYSASIGQTWIFSDSGLGDLSVSLEFFYYLERLSEYCECLTKVSLKLNTHVHVYSSDSRRLLSLMGL